MTGSPRILWFGALLAAGIHAPLAGGASAGARAEYEALKQRHEIQVPPGGERGTDAYFDWVKERARELRERGLAFFAQYPTDPLRWDVLVLLQHSGNLEIIVRADGSKAAVHPAVEAALWRQEYLSRLEDLLESADASRAARQEALLQLIDHYCIEIRKATIDNPRRGLVPSLLAWIRELHGLDPRSNRLPYLYIRVARMLVALEPAGCRAFLEEKYALHPGTSDTDKAVRRNIENFRRLIRNQEEPAEELWAHLQRIEPTFDPAPYRGKVVLIAHLAVDWTLRTMELEELYRKYHDAGLEIIQIAYENRARTVVWDGVTRTLQDAPLVQRDKAAMQRFVEEKKWPWPVLWEKWAFDDRFERFWAQYSVPTFLIVRRDGRIAREVPGELKLDVRVARELAGRIRP